jgi:hypothetical protein
MTDNNDVPNIRRGPEFTERYSNNVRFESSIWDIRMVFGQLDQFAIPSAINQHTSVTVSWAQAKVMLYFLYVNVMFQELSNGKIVVSDSVIPPAIDAGLDENLKNDLKFQAVAQRIEHLRGELFKSNG